MSVYDINWSATLSAASGPLPLPGYALCPNVPNDGYVIATTANLAAVGVLSGIALTEGAPGGTVRVQYSGEVPASLTGLGAGAVAAVRVSATGTLERVTTTPPALTDWIVGDCTAEGALKLSPLSRTNPTVSAVTLDTIGHRLSLQTATPITTTDKTAQNKLYLTAYRSSRLALYTGGAWVSYATDEVSLALSGLTTGTNYDVFAYGSGSAVVLELSAAWASDTARTDALVRQDGVWSKSGALTRRYLGTFRATSTTTTEDSLSRRFMWNQYNRVKRNLKVIDTTTSWTYTVAAWRQARAQTANKFEYVTGDGGTNLEARVQCLYSGTINTEDVSVGVGIDSTTTNSADLFGGCSGVSAFAGPTNAQYQGYPGLGYHAVNWIEYGNHTGNFYGQVNVATDPTGAQSGMIGSVKA